MCKRSVQIESVYRRRIANTDVSWLTDYVKSCNVNLLSLAANLLLWNTIGPIIGSDSDIDEADPLFNPFANSELVSTTFRLSYFLKRSVLIVQEAGLGRHGKSRPPTGIHLRTVRPGIAQSI